MIGQAVSKERKRELDLYKRYAQDHEFKRAFDSSIMRLLSQVTSETMRKELVGQYDNASLLQGQRVKKYGLTKILFK
jgi:hypothetical protein